MLALALTAGACATPDAGVDPTSPPSTVPVPTTMPVDSTPSPSTTAPGEPLLPLGEPGDAPTRLLFSLPTGEGGVTVEGGFEDWEVDGPQALAVARDGSIWVADTGGRRLLRYSEGGALLLDVDTDVAEVAGLVDLAVVGESVWGLEIVPAFDRHRIILFDSAGTLVAEHELPAGLHLGDGLSGIASTPDGRLWIELEGGARVYTAFDDAGTFAPREMPGYDLGGVVLVPVPPIPGEAVARFDVGGTIVERPVREQGSLTFEGATSQWVTLLLSDVAFDADGAVSVRLEALVTDPAGVVLATASYPLEEVAAAAYVPNELLSVGPDGRLVALVPAADRIDVVELVLSGAD